MKLKMPVADFTAVVGNAHLFAAYDATHPAFSQTMLEITEKKSLRLTVVNSIAGCRFSVGGIEGEPGSLCVPTKIFDKLLQGLPTSGEIKLGYNGKQLKIGVGKVGAKLVATGTEDFVSIPKPPRDGWFEVKAVDIAHVSDAVAWSASSDYDNRPVLTGIHLNHKFSEAGDGHCHSRVVPGVIPEGHPPMVIPSAMVQKLRQILSAGRDGVVHVCVGDKFFWFRGKGWALYTLPVAESYYDVEEMVYAPDENGVTRLTGGRTGNVFGIVVARRQLHQAAQRVVRVAANQIMRFTVKDNTLTVATVNDGEKVDNSLRIAERLDWSADAELPADFDRLSAVGFRPRYLASALAPFSSEVVRMLWSDQDNSFQFHDDKGMKMVVMPRTLPGE